MKKCPYGETREDKTVSISKSQASSACKHYEISKWHSYCWRYRVGLDHCNRVDVPMENKIDVAMGI